MGSVVWPDRVERTLIVFPITGVGGHARSPDFGDTRFSAVSNNSCKVRSQFAKKIIAS